jgi:anti-anti-sigma factor
MSITTQIAPSGDTLTINIHGRFDFSSHQAFRSAYEGGESAIKAYIVDMKDTTYLDSSALGMLLLLRDFAGGDNAKISIINCNADVKKIFTISNFELLFDIQ